jgi:hypothetical protein
MLTAIQVRNMIAKATAAEIEIVFIPRIMINQTEDEISTLETRHNNSIGLNAFDAKTITSYYKIVKSGRHLSEEQIEKAKVKLLKYSKQYAEMTAY